MNIDILKEKFDSVECIVQENSFDKIRVNSKDLINLLCFLQNNAEFDMTMLSTIIAIDLPENFELIYDLYSINSNKSIRVSLLLEKNSPTAQSVVDVFKSAYFDECEIFDLFGINFSNNEKLKRLFMPKGWKGHPLRKDYVQDDERLVWNE